MTRKIEDQYRLNTDGEADVRGRIFVSPETAQISDLSGVQVLHVGVDTVRQLYQGKLNSDFLEDVYSYSQASMVEYFGYEWHLSRVGRDSGYQFKLQNADLGLVILFKNFNAKAEDIGPHLKIECSPHLIRDLYPQELQAKMDRIARQILDDCEPNQVAIHIAVDFQGWHPNDLVPRMRCRSLAQRDFSGVERIEFHDRVAVYGRGKSFLWGAANGHQLAIYNKTDQARSIDKLDWWRGVWSEHDNVFDDEPIYDPELPVWRVEHRYHHSIIEQFAQGTINLKTGEVINTKTYSDIAPQLTALWEYGCNSYKLLSSEKSFDPLWTLLRQDIKVKTMANFNIDPGDYEVKRHYKTASGFSGKNVELFLGNFVSLVARERVGVQQAFESLKAWDCWGVIVEYFAQKGKCEERDIYRWLRDKLQERIVRYGVAV